MNHSATMKQIQVSPAFQKFMLCHLAFAKDLLWHLFSLTERNRKRFSAFTRKIKIKQAESKNSIQDLFRKEPWQRQSKPPAARLVPPGSFPGKRHGASQHPALIALKSVSFCALPGFSLCALLSKMRAKESEKPKRGLETLTTFSL